MLAGSLLVGMVIGKPGLEKLSGLFVVPWDGALSLFLLEMGYLTVLHLRGAAALRPGARWAWTWVTRRC